MLSLSFCTCEVPAKAGYALLNVVVSSVVPTIRDELKNSRLSVEEDFDWIELSYLLGGLDGGIQAVHLSANAIV